MLLTKDEEEAVRGYLDQDYMEITPVLYGDEIATPEITQKVSLLDKALAKYESQRHVNKTVYRATKINSEHKLTSVEEAVKLVQNKYPVGSEVTVDGYMSTTANPEALFDFIPAGFHDIPESSKKGLYAIKTLEEFVELESDRSLRGVVMEIVTDSGAPVSSFEQTFAEKEHEWLLSRGKTLLWLMLSHSLD